MPCWLLALGFSSHLLETSCPRSFVRNFSTPNGLVGDFRSGVTGSSEAFGGISGFTEDPKIYLNAPGNSSAPGSKLVCLYFWCKHESNRRNQFGIFYQSLV